MKHQASIQQLLQSKLTEAKGRNPSFSLRAFARKIGMSHSMASRILSGKRQVSRNQARRITEALLLDPQESSEILSLFPEKRKHQKSDAIDPQYLQLSADRFKVTSEWHYFAILSLMKTRDFRKDPNWVAERLGISASKATEALDRLKRLEMIVEDESGRIEATARGFRTSDDVANISLRKAHFTNLDLARRSLENNAVDERDFTSLTLAFRASRLPEAKIAIRKFQDDFDAAFEGAENAPDEVYRLFVGLFPLTRPRKTKEKI